MGATRRVALPPHVVEFSSDDDLAAPAIAALYHAAPASDAAPTLRYRLHRTAGDDWTALSPSRPPFGPASLGDAWAFLEWRAIEDVLNDPGPDVVFVHAAGVRIGPRLVLLLGGSGSGKSTLTAVLLRRGHPMLGDDVLRFAPEVGFFDAVPRSLKLDHQALAWIGLDTPGMPSQAGGTFLAAGTVYISPAALCEQWYAGRGRPWGLVVLDNGPHEGSAGLARRSEGEAAVRLVQSVLGAAHFAAGGARAEARLRLLESLGDTVAYQARGADPAGLADLIVEAAQS